MSHVFNIHHKGGVGSFLIGGEMNGYERVVIVLVTARTFLKQILHKRSPIAIFIRTYAQILMP
ncbi:hypothetical protein IQ255_23455 [Pleurocapsales cyanobacterium LEGE 10410]|nr:hypothetical protein [Pleurocapsales cyanobacterium LEGE 10410]